MIMEAGIVIIHALDVVNYLASFSDLIDVNIKILLLIVQYIKMQIRSPYNVTSIGSWLSIFGTDRS